MKMMRRKLVHSFGTQSEENYDMLMDMMEELIQNGKDVSERQEWERLFDKNKLF